MSEPYGATFTVSAPDAELLGRVVGGLPRGWGRADAGGSSAPAAGRFELLQDERGYRIRLPGGAESASVDLELAVSMLRTRLRRAAAAHHGEAVCLRAGVVTHLGRAILLPGPALVGTSTLVDALVRAGAEYRSDELAMLDADGMVSAGAGAPSSGPVASPGVSVGLVAFAVYRPGASWSPRRLTGGEALVALLGAAVSAQDRPAETLATLRRALAAADVLEGARGAADETAPSLLRAAPATGR